MIYLVAPNATHPSGGVSVAAKWVRLLLEHGHEAMFITPNGDLSPFWLSFKVPTGSYADVQDLPGNKVVHIWMDCLIQFQTQQADLFYYAQDVCQPQYNETNPGRFEAEYLPILKKTKLICIGHHSHWFYLYRWGLASKIVHNWVDTKVFRPAAKEPRSVCMIDHRDHFSAEIERSLRNAGFIVHIARGSETDVAAAMAKSRFFVSDVRGRFDGFEMSEGFPMPIAEAMACGCIPFCRDTNGVREYAYDGVNGFFFTNPAAILECLEIALREPQLEFWAMNAQQTMRAVFSRESAWEQIKEGLEISNG